MLVSQMQGPVKIGVADGNAENAIFMLRWRILAPVRGYRNGSCFVDVIGHGGSCGWDCCDGLRTALAMA